MGARQNALDEGAGGSLADRIIDQKWTVSGYRAACAVSWARPFISRSEWR